MLKEWTVGEKIVSTLLVKSCELKYTKSKKPYLFMILTDGSEDVTANKWDHNSDDVPSMNDIIDVLATVNEYNGSKQLTVMSYRSNPDATIEQFLPRGDFSVEGYVALFEALIEDISDEKLKTITTKVFKNHLNLWLSIPSAVGMHHAYVAGNLKHSVDTALKAKALAQLVPNCNIDLCIAGALLHDVGKLFTYKFNQVIIEMTTQGVLMDHIMIGSQILQGYMTHENAEAMVLLMHIISSHHGEKAYGSPVTPKFIEAMIVSQADMLDARSAILEEAVKKSNGAQTTSRIWAFENHPMFTPVFVAELMEGKNV